MRQISRLTLGTAQLGMNYGIANTKGKPDFESAQNLLSYAIQNDINTIDTGPNYGDSEKIIGTFISSEIFDKKQIPTIISKLPKIDIKVFNFDAIYNHIKGKITDSLKNLNLDKLPYYLLHNASDLSIKEGVVVECLDQLKKEGYIENFGVSIYNPEDVIESLKYKEIKTIQIPINIFDHRLIKTNLINKLKNNGYTIFARSIYLQGLFFKNPNELPGNLIIAKKYLIELNNMAKEFSISVAHLAFSFVNSFSEITSLIIGVEKIEQLSENLDFLVKPYLIKKKYPEIYDKFSNIPVKIINPNLWNK